MTKNIRIWNYNNSRHILNVHYADGSQANRIVHPSKMREVFTANRSGNKEQCAMVLNQLVQTSPVYFHNSRRQVTADEERELFLIHKQTICPLCEDEERELQTLGSDYIL